jgi:hypothetical protein
MCVVVGHHRLNSGICDWLGIIPGVAFQRPAHSFAMLCTESDDVVAIEVKLHLMQVAGTKGRRLVINAVMCTILHFDGGRTGGKRTGREQAHNTQDSEQQGHHANIYGMRFHLHFLSFPRKKKGPQGWSIPVKTGCRVLYPYGLLLFSILFFLVILLELGK